MEIAFLVLFILCNYHAGRSLVQSASSHIADFHLMTANMSRSAGTRAVRCTDAGVELRQDRGGKGNDVEENEPSSKRV